MGVNVWIISVGSGQMSRMVTRYQGGPLAILLGLGLSFGQAAELVAGYEG